MADLSWGPFDCAFERVGRLPANAGGGRPATSSLPILFGISIDSACGEGFDVELAIEPGRSALEAATLRCLFAALRSTLPGSWRASAPATEGTRADRRFTGAALV
jgi:hypothetical protein